MTGPGRVVTRRTARPGMLVMVCHNYGIRGIGRLVKWGNNTVHVRQRVDGRLLKIPTSWIDNVYSLVD